MQNKYGAIKLFDSNIGLFSIVYRYISYPSLFLLLLLRYLSLILDIRGDNKTFSVTLR